MEPALAERKRKRYAIGCVETPVSRSRFWVCLLKDLVGGSLTAVILKCGDFGTRRKLFFLKLEPFDLKNVNLSVQILESVEESDSF